MKRAREAGYLSPGELERVNKIRRDFVANVSHELKTPATSLRLLAESLEDVIEEDPVQARIFASQLKSETERLGQLIIDLLDLARLESGEGLESAEPVDRPGHPHGSPLPSKEGRPQEKHHPELETFR